MKKFGESPPLLKVFSPNQESIRRLAIVLPLQIGSSNVIPIPFIVDTGAPEFMYLGSGAVNELKEVKVVKYITGIHAFRLLGKLCRGDKSIDQPYASSLPVYFEEASIRGDHRLNLLGLGTSRWKSFCNAFHTKLCIMGLFTPSQVKLF